MINNCGVIYRCISYNHCRLKLNYYRLKVYCLNSNFFENVLHSFGEILKFCYTIWFRLCMRFKELITNVIMMKKLEFLSIHLNRAISILNGNHLIYDILKNIFFSFFVNTYTSYAFHKLRFHIYVFLLLKINKIKRTLKNTPNTHIIIHTQPPKTRPFILYVPI